MNQCIRRVAIFLIASLGTVLPLLADGPKDNVADKVRPIPPVGVNIEADKLAVLRARCKKVRETWKAILDERARAQKPKNKWQRAKYESDLQALRDLEPEILVFPRAVEMAIEFSQFHKPHEADNAIKLLEMAEQRIKLASEGKPWFDIVGLDDGQAQKLIVGGYRSKIDGSCQPYSVVVPAGFAKGDSRRRRLDLWFHGRGETLSENNFLFNQQNNAGQYTPADTFVLHPYGRYSNAFKFAGEIDVLESLNYIKTRLPVDHDRVSVRGFSMGGAGCWQMAVHYADHFFAANPGAGFSETPEFLSFFQGEDAAGTAPEHQKTLWQLYDCPPWAANLNQLPTVVYSGEVDRQKQAADVMEKALDKVGIEMTHVIGPDTAHKIYADSKIEIESRMERLARNGRTSVPESIRFRTMTLRYHRMHWIDVRGLDEHWKVASVDATVDDHEIKIETKNVNELSLVFNAGEFPEQTSGPVHVLIDRDEIVGPNVRSDRSFSLHMSKGTHGWMQSADPTRDPSKPLKKPHLQGPIDDAFMDSFVFVLPSGKSSDPDVQKWVESETQHAMIHWRKHFRGDIRAIKDTELTDKWIQNANLILFGDAESNAVMKEILNDLPLEWNENKIAIGKASVPSRGHVPILISANPKNLNRYVVLNSGFTFREYDYLNNARQTPKLPDWALVDVTKGANFQDPGNVIHAGFFDENWQAK